MISGKQKKILAFPYSSYDALICDGAVRSGKTSIMMWAFVEWAMRSFSGQRFGICAKTVGSAKKNIVVPFMAMTAAKDRYTMRWKQSSNELEVRRGYATNIFEVFGGKDESAFALIQGRTFAGVLLDEVVLMPESFVNQALARCSVDGARLWFSCNPGPPSHWFYTEWIKRHEEHNALYLHFTMQDNPSLSEKTLALYESMYPPGVFYDRYVLGLWVMADGLIYQDFSEDAQKVSDKKRFPDYRSKYQIDDIDKWLQERRKRFSIISFGVDFGGTGSATKFQCTGITPDGCVVALDEEYIDHRKESVDPDALNKRYAAFVRKCTGKWGFGQTRADSAEQILIRGLLNTAKAEGLKTNVKNALKMPINDRIKLTLLLMAQGRFFVTKQCPHLIDALSTAVYDSTKMDDERLDDGTTDIDSLDAFEYSIEPWYKQLEAAGHIGG